MPRAGQDYLNPVPGPVPYRAQESMLPAGDLSPRSEKQMPSPPSRGASTRGRLLYTWADVLGPVGVGRVAQWAGVLQTAAGGSVVYQ